MGMTDRTRLIRLLNEIFDHNFHPNVVDMVDTELLSDILIAKGVTFQKWIPVSERLPEDTLPRFSNVKQIKVLTALISDKGVRTVRSQMRYKDTWATGYQTIWRWKYSGSKITHWMPLPEAPKEENND